MALSLEKSTGFLLDASRAVEASLPRLRLSLGCCDIPEQECPPRCVCEIDWAACRGETLKATIRVTNTGSKPQNFSFQATPFQGPGNPPDQIQLAPTNATLAPGGSTVVQATLTVSGAFQSGQQYTAEILIRGAYEQCVRVNLVVGCEAVCHCEVEQGDIPVRIRAHQWYDHFQCEEPCFPPAPTRPPDNRDPIR
jgi:hypothetical protein